MKKLHDANAVVKYLRAQQRAANIGSMGTMVAVEWKFDVESCQQVSSAGASFDENLAKILVHGDAIEL